MLDSEDEDFADEEADDDLGEGTSKSAILSLLGSSGVKGKKTVFVDTAKEGELFKVTLCLPSAIQLDAEFCLVLLRSVPPRRVLISLSSGEIQASKTSKSTLILDANFIVKQKQGKGQRYRR